MIEPGGTHQVGRDWFGLHAFDPGRDCTRSGSVCYLLEETSSTSDFLLGRAPRASGRRCHWDGWGWRAEPLQELEPPIGPRPGRVAVARRQYAGRGRQGRVWVDTQGLFLSWAATVRAASVASGLAVWAGLLVARTLADDFGVSVGLKWPNDLCCDGRKLGGVILDRFGRGAEALIIVGLGINTGIVGNEVPLSQRSRMTSIAEQIGSCPCGGELAGAVLRAFSRELSEFQRTGWTSYGDDFRRLDTLRGSLIDLETPQGIVGGRADGIDEHGALRLRSSDGRVETYSAGNVHVAAIDAGPLRKER